MRGSTCTSGDEFPVRGQSDSSSTGRCDIRRWLDRRKTQKRAPDITNVGNHNVDHSAKRAYGQVVNITIHNRRHLTVLRKLSKINSESWKNMCADKRKLKELKRIMATTKRYLVNNCVSLLKQSTKNDEDALLGVEDSTQRITRKMVYK